jgi:imidazolonepropionase-like amidohydrolase
MIGLRPPTWKTNRRVTALRRAVLQALDRNGVKIATGTDSPQMFSVPGFAIHREMALYVELVMKPCEVLEIATSRPAEYFNVADEFRTVAEGQRADLLLLTANPLNDTGNVARRAGVMLNGRWFLEEEIQLRLEEMARFYGS